MPDNHTILMLGGSAQQVPAIKAARAMGLRTVVMDYLNDNPGRYVADRWYSESTTDIDAVERIARAENAGGILAYASDPAALPAATVAARLGLPGNPPEAVEVLSVKHRFRQFLADNGFASPGFTTFTSDTPDSELQQITSGLTYPIVVKPTDSSGSKGVSFINTPKQLPEAKRYAAAYSRNNILIAEEYIEHGMSDIIGGDIFIENGEIVLCGLMQCIRGQEKNGLIPIGKLYPPFASEAQLTTIRTELERLVQLLGIKAGELNVGTIIGTDGRPYFIEIGPRAGGNMIPIQLSDIFGCNLVEANIRTAMGMPVHITPHRKEGVWMTTVLHSAESGIYSGVYISPTLKPYIYRRCHYITPGHKIDTFADAGKAAGIYFMHFPTEAKAPVSVFESKDLLRIRVTTENTKSTEQS